ncbi:MAG: hypothetical protein Q8O72_15355 [Bacteroidales bacterium]|nr:hypothetical protein [Bacteroidales bacterium]
MIAKRRILFVLILAGMIASCSKTKNNENPQLISKWKLIEQLADPGDGSGVYTPVDSDKTIEFFANGDVISNGSLCTMNFETGSVGRGKYDTTDYSILPENCNSEMYHISYSISNSELTLYYPCIEGCAQKYAFLEGTVEPTN